MKNFLLFLVLLSQQSFSQSYPYPLPSLSTTQLNADDRTPRVFFKENNRYAKAYINNIPSSVLADFLPKYADAERITWIIEANKITGYFDQDNEKIVVNYKKDGLLESTRKTYDSTRLSPAMKYFLRNERKNGYRVTVVTEITNNGDTFYEVTLLRQYQYYIARISTNKEGGLEMLETILFTDANSVKL